MIKFIKKYYSLFLFFSLSFNLLSNDKVSNSNFFNNSLKGVPISYLNKTGLLFINSFYNKVWHTEILVPVLNIDNNMNGLKILGQGKSEKNNLHLIGKDGPSYKFRLFKNHHDLEKLLQNSKFLMKNFIDGGHILLFPYASLLTKYFSDELHILHTNPIICIFPKNDEYSNFSLKMGYLEINPKTKNNPYGSVKILNSQNFLKLYDSKQAFINLKEYIFCRILDLFIGDGDRHMGQWKFAKFKDKKEWAIIPLDRDMAFLSLKGTLGEAIIKTDIDWKSFNYKTDFFSFSEKIYNPIGLMSKSEKLDTIFLNKVKWNIIKKYILEFQNIITDEAINNALGKLPKEIQIALGDEFKYMLITRKQDLIPSMKIYYDYLKSNINNNQ